MTKIDIKKDWISRARDRALLAPAERSRINDFLHSQNSGSVAVDPRDFPPALWRAMLDDAKLTPKVRSALALHVFGMPQTDPGLETIYDTSVDNAVEFGTTFQLAGIRAPNVELFLNGRWYPVILNSRFVEDENKLACGVTLFCTLRLGERNFVMNYFVGRGSFLDDALQTVFARVMRWNAVLQFDECEIFLAKRGNDLERSAIVGIFLRLLDYYRGLLFLTTNRPEVLDDAILSRVMLRLEYPHLDAGTRVKIWQSMFAVAQLRLDGVSFDHLATLDLNGRQIRNLTRLAKILFPDGVLSADGLQEVLHFGCAQGLPATTGTCHYAGTGSGG
jgi:hypothetical protein